MLMRHNVHTGSGYSQEHMVASPGWAAAHFGTYNFEKV